jgi:6-phosphogluconolactonase (cycloisomerase 2 family)
VVGAIPGALTAIGSPVATGTNPVSVTVDASGKFVYVANAGGGVSRYTIASDGTLTSNGTTTAGSGPASVTVAASTGSTVSGSHEFAYVANSGAGTVSGFSVNDSSGALTSVGAAAGAGSTPSSVTTTGTIQ